MKKIISLSLIITLAIALLFQEKPSIFADFNRNEDSIVKSSNQTYDDTITNNTESTIFIRVYTEDLSANAGIEYVSYFYESFLEPGESYDFSIQTRNDNHPYQIQNRSFMVFTEYYNLEQGNLNLYQVDEMLVEVNGGWTTHRLTDSVSICEKYYSSALMIYDNDPDQQYNYIDDCSLGGYEYYINQGVLNLDFTIRYEEVNDGFQTIKVYYTEDSTSSVKNLLIHSDASLPDGNPTTKYFSGIPTNNVTWNSGLFLELGAHGNYEDTWKVHWLTASIENVDNVGPIITGIKGTEKPTIKNKKNIIRITFDEIVEVDPSINIRLRETTTQSESLVLGDYVSGSGTNTLAFEYTPMLSDVENIEIYDLNDIFDYSVLDINGNASNDSFTPSDASVIASNGTLEKTIGKLSIESVSDFLTIDFKGYTEVFDTFTWFNSSNQIIDITSYDVGTTLNNIYIKFSDATNTNMLTTTAFDITIVDSQDPVFSIGENYRVSINNEITNWDSRIEYYYDNNALEVNSSTLNTSIISNTIQWDTFGTYTITLEITNSSNESVQKQFDVEVTDTTSPTFDDIPLQTIEAGSSDIDWTTLIENESDNMEGALLTRSEHQDNVDYNTPGTYFPVVRVTDEYSNYLDKTIEVVVEDTTAPDFDIETITIEVSNSDIDWSTYIANPTDNSDDVLIYFEENDSVDYNTDGTYTNIQVSLSDQSGNKTSKTFTVIVQDTTGPTFNTPGSTIEAGITDIDWTTQITNLDDINDSVTITVVEITDDINYDHIGTYEVTIKAVDSLDNETTESFLVEVVDTTAPNFDDISEQTIEAGTLEPNWIEFIINKTDNSDSSLTDSLVSSTYDSSHVGSYTVTVSVTDQSDNLKEKSFEVNIVDSTEPVLSCPSELTLRLDELTIEDISSHCSVTDYTDIEYTSMNLGTITTIGDYSLNVTVTDEGGNTDVATITLTVVEANPPTFTYTGLTTLEYGDTFNYIDFIIVSDDTDTNPQVNYDSFTIDSLGFYTIQIFALDSFGNNGQVELVFEVIDTTPPTIIKPDNIYINEKDMQEVLSLFTITDNTSELCSDYKFTINSTNDDLTLGFVDFTVCDCQGNETNVIYENVVFEDDRQPTILLNTLNPSIDSTNYKKHLEIYDDTTDLNNLNISFIETIKPDFLEVLVTVVDEEGNQSQKTFDVVYPPAFIDRTRASLLSVVPIVPSGVLFASALIFNKMGDMVVEGFIKKVILDKILAPIWKLLKKPFTRGIK